MRIMLDTNILVSAFIFKSKRMNGLIYRLSKDHEIVICSYTIEELQELMDNKFNVSLQELDDFLKDFPFDLVYSPKNVKDKLFEIRDKDDYIILHTAIIEEVDVFVTGDKDFKDIDIDKPEIMTATEFLEKYYWTEKGTALFSILLDLKENADKSMSVFFGWKRED